MIGLASSSGGCAACIIADFCYAARQAQQHRGR
jgi:hypothetical protein